MCIDMFWSMTQKKNMAGRGQAVWKSMENKKRQKIPFFLAVDVIAARCDDWNCCNRFATRDKGC